MPVGTEAEQEVDFKEVSEEQALSILKVGPAAAVTDAPRRCWSRAHLLHACVSCSSRVGCTRDCNRVGGMSLGSPTPGPGQALEPFGSWGWRRRRLPRCPTVALWLATVACMRAFAAPRFKCMRHPRLPACSAPSRLCSAVARCLHRALEAYSRPAGVMHG